MEMRFKNRPLKMPITHDLPEKRVRTQEIKGTPTRKSRIAREESIDKKPIITQEKPSTSKRDVKKPAASKKSVVKKSEELHKSFKRDDSTTKSKVGKKIVHQETQKERIRTETKTLDISEIKILKSAVDDSQEYESDFEEDDSENNDKEEETDDKTKSTFIAKVEKSFESEKKEDVKTKNFDLQSVLEQTHLQSIKAAMAKDDVRQNHQESDNRNTISDNFQFDFKSATKRISKQQNAMNKRAEDILGMIKLDQISYSFLEIPSIPYETFIRTFGHSNRTQVSVQTNEDSCEELTQTDEIMTNNVWTQFPPTFSYKLTADGQRTLNFCEDERNGYGRDSEAKQQFSSTLVVNHKKLSDFLRTASQKVEVWLTRKTVQTGETYFSELTFSNSQLKFQDLKTMQGKVIRHVQVANASNTIAVFFSREKYQNFIQLWHAFQPYAPIRQLICRHGISAFDLSAYFVAVGTYDGSICLWDLRDSVHIQNYSDNHNCSPTYTTACLWGKDGHREKIVTVKCLSKTVDANDSTEFSSTQICSLDRNGLIIWSVIHLNNYQKRQPNEDLGLAQWGRVKLVKSSTIIISDLVKEESFLSQPLNLFQIQGNDSDGILVACNNGLIIHSSTFGELLQPKIYGQSDLNCANKNVTNIEMHPTAHDIFLAGYSDGSIKLFNIKKEKYLITLNGSNEIRAAIVSIKWLPNRPCVFFSLDALGRLNLWDLAVWDMYPVKTVSTIHPKINSIDLWTPKSGKVYLILGMDDAFFVCNLIGDYATRNSDEIAKELKHFRRYINIL